jgi:hypothetical protein
MLLAGVTGRAILPLLKYKRAANDPRTVLTRPIQLEWGEPGVKMGQ